MSQRGGSWSSRAIFDAKTALSTRRGRAHAVLTRGLAVNQSGRARSQSGNLSTTAELLALSDWLSANDCTHVAMEATGVCWKPVWHVLSDGELQLILANAAHVKNVPERKTDVSDATRLAELLAHGLIRASFVPDGQTPELRTLLRARKQLVRERSRHI
jgi:transposase